MEADQIRDKANQVFNTAHGQRGRGFGTIHARNDRRPDPRRASIHTPVPMIHSPDGQRLVPPTSG